MTFSKAINPITFSKAINPMTFSKAINPITFSKAINPVTFSKAINPMTFLKVASGNEDEVIDLEFVHSLISNGASVHTTDRHGQSVLHEAARDWDLGIAEFLLDNGE